MSTSGSLPEIVGDAAITFDASDVQAIERAIDAAMSAGDTYFEAGVRRAAAFTWAACAQKHVDVYRGLLR